MKVTKYEHACVVLEEQGKRLVIDPGEFTRQLTDLTNISAVVVSHVHSDHFDIARLKAIRQANPGAVIYAPSQVASKAPELNIQTVAAGENYKADGFELAFYGGTHELYAEFDNVAVLVNDSLLHPGDSYTTINKPVKVLGLPASAPWLRVADTIDYLNAVKPVTTFPIHDSLLSKTGQDIHYGIISRAAEQAGIQWKPLAIGQSMEV